MPRYKHDQTPPGSALVGTFRERVVYKVFRVDEAFSLNRDQSFDPSDTDDALSWEDGGTYIMYPYLDGELIGNPVRIAPRKLRAFMEAVPGAMMQRLRSLLWPS